MIRPLIVVACLGIAYVASITFKDVPPELAAAMPKEVRDFVQGLTPNDIAILRDVAENYSRYKTEDAAIAAIRARSPQLGDQVARIHKMIEDKMNSLSPPAKAFAREMYRITRRIHTEAVIGKKPDIAAITSTAQKAIAQFNQLPKPVQQELKRTFPATVRAFTSKKVHKMLARMLASG
ncbi:nematode fatty acid retinoid binding protein [Cooperia oncophora]